jgi:hypothetical protein
MSTERQMVEEKFRHLVAEAGEHFGDYIIIARTPDALFWKTSDESWAVGAVMRYAQHIQNKDLMTDLKAREQ